MAHLGLRVSGVNLTKKYSEDFFLEHAQRERFRIATMWNLHRETLTAKRCVVKVSHEAWREPKLQTLNLKT